MPGITISCTECELQSQSLRLKQFEVLGCEPAGADGMCLLRYQDPVLDGQAATARSLEAPRAPTARDGAAAQAGTALPVPFAGKAQPMSADRFEGACSTLRVPPEALWSILKVETAGCGFLPDRRPKILYERHVFSRLTGHRFDDEAPGISSPVPGGYVGGAAEYYRLTLAMALDREKALESASWGLGQVMGFNARSAGFRDVQDLITTTCESEDGQLRAMVTFIEGKNLAPAMRKSDWTTVAKGYNGKAYKTYDKQLARWHAHFQAKGLPDVAVRQAQVALLLLGYASEGSVDGIYGRHTRDALQRFQRKEQLAGDGSLNDETLARLRQRAGWD